MRIKKTKKNDYVYVSGLWIRNFARENAICENINIITSEEDRKVLSYNEQKNKTFNISNISNEKVNFEKVVIVSDGHDFENKHKLISKFPSDVSVIAINGALNKWSLLDRQSGEFRTINIYLVNNPYKECMKYIPSGTYFPTCILSSRTYPDFVKSYKGNKYLYDPSPESEFGFDKKRSYFIDDYRNPVCAAIGLSYRFNVKKLMLMCCDGAFKSQRSGSMQIKNGLWIYPQEQMAQKIIDANLYWLKNSNKEIKIVHCSDGAEYVNAVYIKSDEHVIQFFEEETN